MNISNRTQLISSVFHMPALSNSKVCDTARRILRDLDGWEQTPPADKERVYSNVAHEYGDLLCAAQTAPYGIFNYILSILGLAPSVAETEKLLTQTRQRLHACEYRWNIVKKTDKDSISPSLLTKLTEAALSWKANQKLYTPKQKESLTAHDIRQLKKIARYERFATEVLSSKKELNNLFKFTLRDLYNVSCYVQFPKATETLYKAHLTSQVNAFHGVKLLKRLRNSNNETESLALKFSHVDRYVDIFHETCVEVAPDTTVTIQGVFDDFRSQNWKQGEYQMFRGGVTKWRMNESWTNHFGPEASHSWYENLPVEDILSFDEIKKRYPEINKGQWLIGFETTREHLDRNIQNTHGYMVIYKPQKDGTYRSWSFGVYAKEWPTTKLGLFLMIGDTAEATWCSPDPCCRYSQRQKATHPRFLSTPEEQQKFEERFFKALSNDELIFQWGGENCAYQAEQIVTEEEVPNLIRTRIDSVKAPWFLWPWTVPYYYTPKFLRLYALQPILLSLLGWRSRYGKSLMNSDFPKKGEFHLPATLHEKVFDGSVLGYVWGGHNRDDEVLKNP